MKTSTAPQAPAARPVNFAGWEVAAALEGRATQFRRVVKDVPAWCDRGGFSVFCGDGEAEFRGRHPNRGPASVLRSHKFGRSGDRLWVRESFARVPMTAYRCSVGVQQTIDPTERHYAAVYAAGWERCKPGSWRSSATMPRWASRLLLEITAIRVERVQSLTHRDACALGWPDRLAADGTSERAWIETIGDGDDACIEWAADQWDSAHPAGLKWDDSPWCWVVEYKRVVEGSGAAA